PARMQFGGEGKDILIKEAETFPKRGDECIARIPESVDAVASYWRENPVTEAENVLRGDSKQPPRRRGGRWVH
ncbi:MAG: hypothetical protein ABI650_02885, partial [Dokdonella sp.]